MRFVLSLLGVLTAGALVAAPGLAQVSAENGVIRQPLGGRDVTAAYMILTADQGDALVAASTPIAEEVELHTHIHEDGVMRMRRVDDIALPAGEAVRFQPGGLHLMLFGVSEDLTEGEAAPITLNFASGAQVTIDATVAVDVHSAGEDPEKPCSCSDGDEHATP